MKDSTKREINILLERYPVLADMRERLTACVELMSESFRAGGKLLVCGNGGSAADSLHIAGELMKGFVLERPLPEKLREVLRTGYPDDAAYYIANLQGALPVISLTGEISLVTAYSNDKAADLIFAQQVLGYGMPGDVLLAISTSGASSNVIHAARVAKATGMKVVSLTGLGGGMLAKLSDVLLDVPTNVTHHVQELHLPVYHALCLALEQELFGGQGSFLENEENGSDHSGGRIWDKAGADSERRA